MFTNEQSKSAGTWKVFKQISLELGKHNINHSLIKLKSGCLHVTISKIKRMVNRVNRNSASQTTKLNVYKVLSNALTGTQLVE